MKTYIDSYDELFMNMAYLAAMKSKDIKTHVGAVIVGPDNEVRSLGFNSFPRGINDNVLERQERPEKYNWFAHSEKYFRTLTMFKEANITIRYLKTELVQIIRFKDGEVI